MEVFRKFQGRVRAVIRVGYPLKAFCLCVVLGWAAGFGTNVSAQWTEVYVPEEISEWSRWVVEGLPDDYWCPWEADDESKLSCVWPINLEIDIRTRDAETIAHFTLEVQLFDEADIDLPYDRMPYDVRLNGKPAIVGGSDDSSVAVTAPRGRHTVTGKLRWHTFPNDLVIPPGTVRLSLTVDGMRVRRPIVEDSILVLQQDSIKEVEHESDSLSIRVYRRLVDSVPQLLSTFLELSVAGTNRRIDLGNVLPSGFKLLSIDSRIPVRANDAGDISLLVRPGQWEVELEARAVDHLSEFSMTFPTEEWPAAEIWGIESRENIRSIRIEGVPQTDLSQTGSPFPDIAGFVLREGETLRLVELSRGDTSPDVERAEVLRRLWLGFGGDQWVAHDILSASLNRESRLSAGYPLGRITIDDRPRLISTLDSDSAESGIAVPKGEVKIEAVSEISSGGRWLFRKFRAVGWNVDAASLAISATLPPQWLALWAGGADSVKGTWIHSWTLWDVFLIALLVVVTIRVAGPRWAAMVALASVLLFIYNRVPVVGWLVLVAIAALGTALSAKAARLWIGRLYWIVAVPVFAISAYIAVFYVLDAIYPQFDFGRDLTQMEEHRGLEESAGSDEAGDVEDDGAARIEERLTVTGSRIARDAFTSRTPSQIIDAQKSRDEDDHIDAANILQESSAASGQAITIIKTQEQIGDPVWVQTGPGMPVWPDEGIESLNLEWSGPVGAEQDISLILLPPVGTRLASLLTAGLILTVLWMLIWIRLRPDAVGGSGSGAKLLPFVFAAWLVPDAFAEVPSIAILEEIKQRYLAPPACLPSCANLEVVSVSSTNNELELELTIHVDAQGGEGVVSKFGAPLPIIEPSVLPFSAVVGEGQQPLLREDIALLWVPLDRGIHKVQLRYDLSGLDRIEINFYDLENEPSRVVTGQLDGWSFVSHPDTARSLSSLTLTRESPARQEKPEPEDEWEDTEATLTPYARVSRYLEFTREPTIETTVTRLRNSAEGPIEIVLPLLEGEIVTDEWVENDGTQMKIGLNAYRDIVRVQSKLQPSQLAFSMTAPVNVAWSESWGVQQSDYWNASFEGLDPVKSEGPVTLFRPRPGESLTITLSQPQPADGNSITFTYARLHTSVSSRYRVSFLTLDVLASLGDTAKILLPDGAQIKNIAVNDSTRPVPQSNEVSLPIEPGEGQLRVEWVDQNSLGAIFRGPGVEVSAPLRNVHNSVFFPPNRWVLLIGGPGMGPGILTWGIVLIVVVVAIALTRIANFPLRPVDAVLLSLGVTLVNLDIALLLAIWFLAIWYRRAHPPDQSQRGRYIATQCLFALLSVATIVALVLTVPSALLGQPQMEVFGLGSSAHEFFWFNDQTDGTLPVPWIFSLPLWVYHLLMVGWGFWLAFALVRWVRTAWAALAQPILWPKGIKVEKPATEG